MFEKEAEDKAFEKYPIPQVWNEIHLAKNIKYQEGFQDGAEFGYNKANEWHYVKDELPPLDTNVLVIHKWHRTPEVGKRITVFSNSSVWVWAMCCDRYRYTSEDKDVIAWKEIVLPELKEIKENDIDS